MKDMTILKEPDIKAAVIDWLLKKNLLEDDAVLINELPVAGFSRRVDLALANGKLQAFEIKSDADSLVRLEGQISTYKRYFDKVTLVCSSRFTDKVLDLLPSEVEILEVAKDISGVSIKVRRRGKTVPIRCTERFLSFVDKAYLLRALRREKLACHAGMSREKLYTEAGSLSIKKRRELVLSYLKEKYTDTFENFVNNKREALTSPEDLAYLSRNKLLQADDNQQVSNGGLERWPEEFISEKQLQPGLANSIDITKRLERFGIVVNEEIRVAARYKG